MSTCSNVETLFGRQLQTERVLTYAEMQEEVVSSQRVTRKALEPVFRIFQALYSATLATLSRMSDRDPKHGPRLVMENLSFLRLHMTDLAELVPDLAVCAKDLSGNLTRAQDQYVDQQLQHSKIWPLMLLSGQLQVLLKDVRPAEIRFQVRPLFLVPRYMFLGACTP